MSNLFWLPRPGDKPIDAALAYADNGFAIFPCSGKTPAVPNGFHDASCDRNQVNEWFTRMPDANIGLSLPAGLFALDVDIRHGGEETLRRLEHTHGILPFTLRATTGASGDHYIYTRPSGMEIVQGAHVVGRGVDTRVSGKGYLVVSPSIHPDTKQAYRWHSIFAPVMAPDWLLEIVKAKPVERIEYKPTSTNIGEASRRERYARAALHGMAKKMAVANEGERNSLLNWCWFNIAGFRDALPLEECRSELLRAATAAGLSEREALQVMR